MNNYYLAAVIVLVVALAAYYYFYVYKAKEGYHNAWGAKTPAETVSRHSGCGDATHNLVNGCKLECAVMPHGLTYTDCMQRCTTEPNRKIPSDACASCQ